MRADRLIINVLIITDIRGLFNSYTQHFVILRKTRISDGKRAACVRETAPPFRPKSASQMTIKSPGVMKMKLISANMTMMTT